jgi:hypothetical protein
MMRIHTRILTTLVVVCAVSGPALAGPPQVFSNWAMGDMGTAHNMAGSQYVGCWLSSDPIGPPLMFCEVNDGAGNDGFCYSTSINFQNMVQSMEAVSEIRFGWDGSHNCSWLFISDFSQPPGRKFP